MSGRFRQLDTSNEYAGGRSETLIGQVLGTAGEVTVFSKADRDHGHGRVRRRPGDALVRGDALPARRRHAAVYHLHDPFTITVREAMAPGGAVPALVSLRGRG
ncbi:hypothetical protein, partial [Nonomuraea rubra]|uniref:hypothetical protein n=1 Tax=Nonomuraea rubra TaxID=46180 RepID=UPI0031E941BF